MEVLKQLHALERAAAYALLAGGANLNEALEVALQVRLLAPGSSAPAYERERHADAALALVHEALIRRGLESVIVEGSFAYEAWTGVLRR